MEENVFPGKSITVVGSESKNVQSGGEKEKRVTLRLRGQVEVVKEAETRPVSPGTGSPFGVYTHGTRVIFNWGSTGCVRLIFVYVRTR